MPTTPLPPFVYRVAMPTPQGHEFAVTLAVPAMPTRPQPVLAFPAWIPGSYMVRDFVRHVYDLEVTDLRGRPLGTRRLDKQRWQIDSGGAGFEVRYRVFAFDESVRAAFLDGERAFWNGTSLFFYVEDEKRRPCTLAIETPRGWQISTGLSPVRGKRHTYSAAHYDELVDSPVAVGAHRRIRFREGGARFEIAWYGRTNADMGRVTRGIRAIVATTGRLFGGFPFRDYVFFINAMPQRGGGLEHATSCTCNVEAYAFVDEAGYQAFFELCAHEFFHAWNVKRIACRVLGPFDYEKENYTTLLWFHEGFTDYMETPILRMAGLITPDKFLADLADAYGKFLAMPGRNASPLSQLSFEAWIKQYKPAENFSNRAVSYYEKGKWVGLALDLELRTRTRGRRGLPDLFRLLWRRFGRRGQGLVHDDIVAAASELAGAPLTSFFRRFVDGTAELPVPAALAAAGIAVRERGADDSADATQKQRAAGFLGVSLRTDAGTKAVIKNVIPGAAADAAGLTFNDELVAIDGVRVEAGSFSQRVRDHRPGARIEVAYFRNNQLRSTRVVLGRNSARAFTFAVDDHAAAGKRAIRRRWLGV